MLSAPGLPAPTQGRDVQLPKTASPGNASVPADKPVRVPPFPVSDLAVKTGLRADVLPAARAKVGACQASACQSVHRPRSTEACVQIVLYSVVTVLLGFVALPNGQAPSKAPGVRSTVQARLAALRAAVDLSRRREGHWPPSLVVLVSAGQPAPQVDLGCLPVEGCRLPATGATDPLRNPLNGLSTVWVLAPDAVFPSTADGTSGWIYSPTTGEVRINAQGVDESDGEPWIDL